jgi:N-acyl-D-amino-acid deacylase
MMPRVAVCSLLLLGAAPQAPLDVVIRGGTVYDGTGTAPRRADVGLRGDQIVAVGDLLTAPARNVVDATGLAVAPGFVNMLSWSTDTLIADGRSQGEIREGVTLEVFGEGFSFGPLNDAMKQRMTSEQGDIKYEIGWTTLAEYLEFLEKKGIAPNVASFIGSATLREYAVGLADARATPEQTELMKELVRREMEAGALGIGSSLIYAPDMYSTTEELIELCRVAAKYKGHVHLAHAQRGDRLLEAVDELIRISREAGLPAEIYHLKAAGESNWPKLDRSSTRSRRRARGSPHHGRHVQLHGRRDGLRRLPAALGARRGHGGRLHADRGARDAPADPRRRCARRATGRTCASRPARRSGSCSWSSRATH